MDKTVSPVDSCAIPGLPVMVDSLDQSAKMHFLTHYHGDHLNGLEDDISGMIVASSQTVNLIREFHRVPEDRLKEVKPGKVYRFRKDGLEYFELKVIDANHCPGAVMYLFRHRGRGYLHTGDFRYLPELHDCLAEVGPIDRAWVDGTYHNYDYRFPPLEDAIRLVVELISEARPDKVVMGIYSIGKTKLVEEVVSHFGEPFYVSQKVYRAYRAIGLSHLVTRKKESTRFYGYGRGYIEKYFRWDGRCLVIIPTGWACDSSRCDHRYHYVPYSEHSDYRELEHFKRVIDCRDVVIIR